MSSGPSLVPYPLPGHSSSHWQALVSSSSLREGHLSGDGVCAGPVCRSPMPPLLLALRVALSMRPPRRSGRLPAESQLCTLPGCSPQWSLVGQTESASLLQLVRPAPSFSSSLCPGGVAVSLPEGTATTPGPGCLSLSVLLYTSLSPCTSGCQRLHPVCRRPSECPHCA